MKRLLVAALLIAACVAPLRAADRSGVPILMYHKVDPHTPRDAVGRSLTLDPPVFAAQLAWLRDHHIRTLTVNELVDALAHGEHPRNAVVLTFDDGYTDAATIITPLLQRFGARASFYVTSGFLGDGRHVTWAQLRAMRAAGMEIGCHGTSHTDLALMNEREAAFEIGHCVETLGHYLARPTTYAYAAGRFTGETEAIVRRLRLKAALSERTGTVAKLGDAYALPRRRVDRDDGMAAFAAIATP